MTELKVIEKGPFYYHITDNGYTYDKRIFWGVMALLLIAIVMAGFQQGFSYNFYFKCDNPSGCVNPLYTAEARDGLGRDLKGDCTGAWCTSRKLPPGEYGTKPSPLFEHFSLLAFSLIILGLVLNHFIHNKGKPFGVKLNLPDKFTKYIKEKWGNLEDD